jgi:chemotaxis protein methyltransferase CheR
MLAPTYSYVADLVRRRSCMTLAERQIPWLEARLTPLARQLGVDSVDAMVERMRTDVEGELHDLVVESVAVTETSFFRDPAIFDELGSEVLPKLWAERPERPVRIWSAGCASGQEPYSIAMVGQDFVTARPGAQVAVLASDFSAAMVARTERATYSHLEVNRGLPARRLVQSMVRDGTEWRVRPELTSMVTVRRHNLALDPMPGLSADIVFLRNVLIYFDTEVRRTVLSRVVQSLAPGGYLFLGGSEWTADDHRCLVRGRRGRATWYRLHERQVRS